MDSATAAALPDGVRLGVDVGTVRVGIAATDPDGRMAFPVATIARHDADAAAQVVALAQERAAAVIYVGLPLSLSGGESASTVDARQFAARVAELSSCVVRLTDERLSTVTATARMREAGRSSRQQRGVIDQAAAVVLLESALASEKRGNIDSVAPAVIPEGES